MSAAWLMDNAQFYEQPVFRKAHLEFGEGSLMDGRLLKVGNILESLMIPVVCV